MQFHCYRYVIEEKYNIDNLKNVHSSTIFNSPKLETTQLSINSRLDCGIYTQCSTTEQWLSAR